MRNSPQWGSGRHIVRAGVRAGAERCGSSPSTSTAPERVLPRHAAAAGTRAARASRAVAGCRRGRAACRSPKFDVLPHASLLPRAGPRARAAARAAGRRGRVGRGRRHIGTPRHSPLYREAKRRGGIKRDFARSVEVAATANLMTTPSAPRPALPRSRCGARRGDREPPRAEHIGRERPRHRGIVIGLTRRGEHADGWRELDGPKAAVGCSRGARRRARHDDRLGPRSAARTAHPCDQTWPWKTSSRPSGVRHRACSARRHRLRPRALEREAQGVRRCRSDVARPRRSARTSGWARSRAGSSSRRRVVRGPRALRAGRRRSRALMERARAWAARQSADRAAAQWETALTRAVARTRAVDALRRSELRRAPAAPRGAARARRPARRSAMRTCSSESRSRSVTVRPPASGGRR